ncbi:MAG TPA: transposase [Macromonas sp.]|nr:transposase [Macromonas sp.]
MARLPRLTLAGVVHHVVLRGNNRQTVFLDRADRESFLALLSQQATLARVQLHAYVLLDDRVHLLLTPQSDDALPQMMQAVGRAYVRRFNQRHGRSGTLWEGRYRSTLIEAEQYLLPCMVYMDTSPVRAGLVQAPEAYAWSSHAHYVGLRHETWLTPHPLLWSLGNTPFAREAAYAERVRHGLDAAQLQVLEQTATTGWALGGEVFLAALTERTERRLVRGKPGRPVRPKDVVDKAAPD